MGPSFAACVDIWKNAPACEDIEQALEQLDEEPSAEQCPGIDGIKKEEHDDFVAKESP
jgi:ferritin-like metal-binding protein YciE